MNQVTFEWPTPPYFNLVLDAGIPDSQACYIYLRNGSQKASD